QGGEALAVGLGAQVGGERHLADVELLRANHAPEGLHQHRYLDEVELEALGRDPAVLQGLIVALRSSHRLQPHRRHLILLHMSATSPRRYHSFWSYHKTTRYAGARRGDRRSTDRGMHGRAGSGGGADRPRYHRVPRVSDARHPG